MSSLLSFLRLLILSSTLLGLAACEGCDGGEPIGDPAPETTSESADHCEHGLPPSICAKCTPALAAVYRAQGDFCEEHGFAESFCPQCNPDAPIPVVDAVPAGMADWCGGHGLPESQCTKCNRELIPRYQASGDWCEEHEFPESVCPICNPMDPPDGSVTADWCVEHGLPESSCTQCNPTLRAEFEARGDYCEEHGFPESMCPVCNPQPPPPGAERAAIETRVVRFQSEEIEASAGIETVVAGHSEASPAVECTARIAFHGDRVADVRAIVPGVVRQVRVELGAEVEEGAPLFDLESTRVGEIQGALAAARERVRTAEANVSRQRELLASDIASQRQVDLAERELASASSEARTAASTLRMAGAAGSGPSGRYSLSSPIAGTVVLRPAVIGLLATESESLATIADTSVMWVLCDVPESDASRVELGQRVEVMVDGREQSFSGELTWIAAEVEARSRTVTARAEVSNPEGRLRANQFARARIETGASRAAATVPREAVQRVGEYEVVFVRVSPGVFEPRVVERYGGGGQVQVEGRVEAGDRVVTTGAVLLRTEITPGSIGAGCCEVEPPGAE